MLKLYYAWNNERRVSFNNSLRIRQFVGACKRLLHNQKIFNARFPRRVTYAHVLRCTFYLLFLRFAYMFSPFLSPSMCGARSFMVVRQDIAAMVTLYVRQGRAPASRSGCAMLRSAAKDCIEKITHRYMLALIYIRGIMLLEKYYFDIR